MKIIETFGETRLKFVTMKDHRQLKNDFHRPEKIAKGTSVWTKNEENFEKVSIKF